MPASFSPDQHGEAGTAGAPIEALRRFARKRGTGAASARSSAPVEHCELCSEVIPADHRHLLDLSSRALICACQACSLLFSDEGAGAGKYRMVPRRFLLLADFRMTDQQWDELCIPVGMAFLFRSTGEKPVMAFYPSPAGATESLLDLSGWEALAQDNPVLHDLVPDVEALLIHRIKDAREYFVVPIDSCYQLVGLIRSTWRGLSGGTEAQEAIATFFADVRARAHREEGGTRDA